MLDKDSWKEKEFSFFSHRKCEYFPCHDTEHPEDFNCLFCYCPLYALKDRCGGNFQYTKSGVKDCSGCSLPHKRKNYEYIMDKFKEIQEITKLGTAENK
jgi:Zn-finger protein